MYLNKSTIFFAQIFEYLIKDNNKDFGKYAEYYTPNVIARIIVRILVKHHWLRGVVSMLSNNFATTGTIVSIIIIDKQNSSDKVMLMDASKLGEKVKEDGKNQKTVLKPEEIEKIVNTFNNEEVVDDFSILVSYEEIAKKNCSFSTGQYFEVKINYVELAAEETVQREFCSYDTVKDNYPKYVLSLDDFDFSQNGIIHKNIIKWLLEEK